MRAELRRIARTGALKLVMLCAIVGVAIGVGFTLRGLDVSPRALLPRATRSVVVVRPSPNVVTAVHQLSRLESAEYHLERVVDVTDRQSRAFGLVQAEDSLVLVVAGDVIAGVDLSGVDDDDVQVDHAAKRVRVRLPAPKVLSARLDSQRTYVHSRSTDLFAKPNARLESDARARAEKQLTQAAIEAGILDKAGANARRSVADLLKALGFRAVEVTVDSPARGGV